MVKTITINHIRCLYSAEEVRRAETEAGIIESLRDGKGNRIFSATRAQRIAGRKQWREIIEEMREGAKKRDEGGRNQKKSGRGRGKAQKP